MKYLITGGCGFIGVNFADQLLKRGDQVIIADNLSRKGTCENLNYLQQKYPQIKFHHLDIRSDNQLLTKLSSQVDIIHHLAGQVAVTTSIKRPKEDFDINALGTFNLLEAIRQSGHSPILIFASTNKVYGGMENIKTIEKNNRYQYRDHPQGISEDQLLDFHSPYGCSKGAADQYVRDYARIFDLKTIVMRQSCIYGTRQFGIEDQGWVAWFTIAALLDKQITIYGDGKQIRDVLYIDDLFTAWDAAASNIQTTSGKVYNVGGGTKLTLSLLELIKLLETTLDKKITVKYDDWRAGDQPVYVSDITSITKDTKWKPKTSINIGIKKLSNWVVDNKKVLEKILK